MANYKAQYTAPKAEDIVLNKNYAFTINPEHQCDTLSISVTEINLYIQNRISAHYRYVKKQLFNLKGSAYKLYLEISPLGRIHWHGYIQIGSIKTWLERDILILKQIGSFCIKEITDEKVWLEYCTKQQKLWAFCCSQMASLLFLEDKEERSDGD